MARTLSIVLSHDNITLIDNYNKMRKIMDLSFGEKLNKARTELGLNMHQLSKEVGIFHYHISLYEKGLRFPRLVTYYKFKKYFESKGFKFDL